MSFRNIYHGICIRLISRAYGAVNASDMIKNYYFNLTQVVDMTANDGCLAAGLSCRVEQSIDESYIFEVGTKDGLSLITMIISNWGYLVIACA